MEIITKLIEYFKTINSFYNNNLNLYNKLQPIIKKKSKQFNSEVYYPSSYELLDELLNENSNLFKEILNISDDDIDNLKKITDSDLRIELIGSISNDINNNSKFDEFKTQIIEYNIKQTILDNLKLDDLILNESTVNNYTGNTNDICVDEKLNDEYLNDILDQYKENITKKIDDDLNELLNKCRITKDSEFDVYKQLNDEYSQEEIDKILNDCFDDSVNSNLDNYDKDFIPKTELSDSGTVGDDETFNNPNIGFDTLKDLMSDSQKKCFNELLNNMNTLQEKNQTYTNHIANKTIIQKEYCYYKLMNTMYKIFYDYLNNITNKTILDNLKRKSKISTRSIGTNLIISDTLNLYSNEYKFIKYKETNSITLFDFEIQKTNKPKGKYFDTFKKFESEFKKEKYKNGQVKLEEIQTVEKQMDIEFEKDLKSFESIVIDNATSKIKDYVKYLITKHLTTSKVKSVIKDNLPYLNNIYTNINTIFKDKENIYINFNNIKDELLADVNSTIKNMEMLQIKCNGGVQPKIFNNIIPNDTHTDFRGIPDPTNPTMYDKEYWVKFAELATTVGLTPIPQFTGSNDIKVDILNYKNPNVKIPTGGIAIDDGIPRFLFYPIGMVIPSPVSPDGLLKIPIPAIYINIFNFTVVNPLDKIKTKLIEIVNNMSEWTTLSKYIGTDKTFEQALNLLPNASVYNLLLLLGIPVIMLYDVPLNFIKDKLKTFDDDVKSIFNGVSFSDLDLDSMDFNNVILNLGKDIDDRVINLRSTIQTELDNINESLTDILEPVLSLKLDKYVNQLDGVLNNISTLINAFESLTSGSVKCVSGIDTNLGLDKSTKPILNKIKEYAKIGNTLNGLITLPKLQLPYIKISEYLYINKNILYTQLKLAYDKYGAIIFDNILQYLNLDEIFPKLKDLKNEIVDDIKGLIDKIIKYQISESKIDIRKLINFKLPNWILANIGMANLDFPELIIVGFIAQSGVVPYPVVMCINPTKKEVPGLIEPLSIKLILTLDSVSPMKLIKIDWGSRILPLNTIIDTIINADLGLNLKPSNAPIPNLTNILKPLYNGLYNPINIINNFGESLRNLNLNGLNFDWQKFDVKNIFNVFNIPNPNLICKMIEAEDYKDSFDKLLSEISLNTTVLPPRLSQLQTLNGFKLPNFDGDSKLIIDDMKTIFNVDEFPSLKDIINVNEIDNNVLILSILGMSSLASIDLIPQLTKQSPYIQDDLPPWERLNLKNIPFVLFLIEFLIASKKGCKLPLPELPHLNM